MHTLLSSLVVDTPDQSNLDEVARSVTVTERIPRRDGARVGPPVVEVEVDGVKVDLDNEAEELPAHILSALATLRDGCGPNPPAHILHALNEVEAAHRRRLKGDGR